MTRRYSAQDVAAGLGVPYAQVWRWLSSGEMEAAEVAPFVVTESALDTFIQKQTFVLPEPRSPRLRSIYHEARKAWLSDMEAAALLDISVMQLEQMIETFGIAHVVANGSIWVQKTALEIPLHQREMDDTVLITPTPRRLGTTKPKQTTEPVALPTELMTVSDVAYYLGETHQEIVCWVRYKYLAAATMTRPWKVQPFAVEAFVRDWPFLLHHIDQMPDSPYRTLAQQEVGNWVSLTEAAMLVRESVRSLKARLDPNDMRQTTKNRTYVRRAALSPDEVVVERVRKDKSKSAHTDRRQGVTRGWSEAELDAIRQSTEPAPVLSQRYGVSDTTIYSIRSGKTYKKEKV